MFRMIVSQSAQHAKSYYSKSLEFGDYYTEGQEVSGSYHGKISKRLGLQNNAVTQENFHRLCDNQYPDKDEMITPRTYDHRRVGYDLNFHAPKSVSILANLGKDKRVIPAFEKAVHATMGDLEAMMNTRVRLNGENRDRHTGELLYGHFVHHTARPTKGHAPDPHLHAHCFVFNITYDEVEGRMKAGEFYLLKKHASYFEKRFLKRLADNLAECGYGIRKTPKSFELSVIPEPAINLFSKRTDEIGRIAKDQDITDPKELDQLGARTRSSKDPSLSMEHLTTMD